LVRHFINAISLFRATAPLLYRRGSDRSRARQQADSRYVSELPKMVYLVGRPGIANVAGSAPSVISESDFGYSFVHPLLMEYFAGSPDLSPAETTVFCSFGLLTGSKHSVIIDCASAASY
jgi:hypothetical protein